MNYKVVLQNNSGGYQVGPKRCLVLFDKKGDDGPSAYEEEEEFCNSEIEKYSDHSGCWCCGERWSFQLFWEFEFISIGGLMDWFHYDEEIVIIDATKKKSWVTTTVSAPFEAANVNDERTLHRT